MTKTLIAKRIISFVVASGTSRIIGGIVQNNTSPKSTYDAVAIASGSIVLGMMAADATKKFTDEQIDKLIAQWKEAEFTSNS